MAELATSFAEDISDDVETNIVPVRQLRKPTKAQDTPENKVAWLWGTETKTPTEKLVLAAIVQMYNERHLRAWPSQLTLCKMTGLSERTVGRAIKGLEAQGIVQVEPHVNAETGAQEANRYYLPIFDPRSRRTKYLPVLVQHHRTADGSYEIARYDAKGNPLDD